MKYLMKIVLALALAVVLPAAAQNISGTAIAPGPQTAATVNSPLITNLQFTGAHVIVNVSAYTSGSYTLHVQGYDAASQSFYDILVTPPIAATGVNRFTVSRGAAPLANAAAADFLPVNWRVQLVGASTPSMTLSVGYNLEQ